MRRQKSPEKTLSESKEKAGTNETKLYPEQSGKENDGEFDPGSERTLAARLNHASRAAGSNAESGGLVSNTWITNPDARDSL